ncbi:hypothetical protein Hanom_Chr08g00705441 [Helianthus anomalus]
MFKVLTEIRPGKRVGSGRVMRQYGSIKKGFFWFGSKQVRVKMSRGQNGLGLKRVRVRTGSGRVGSVKNCFLRKNNCITRGKFVGLKRVRVNTL